MSIESFPRGADENENINEKREKIRITTLEEYLVLIKNNPPSTESETIKEERIKDDKNKIISNLTNNIYRQEIELMSKHGLAEPIGYYSTEQKLDHDVEFPYAGGDYVLQTRPVYDEKNQIIGKYYFKEKVNLSEIQEALKKEIIENSSKFCEDRGFWVEQEINNQLEQRVVNGEMVYLGEKTIEQYIDLISKGFPSNFAEKVIIFDSTRKNYLDTLSEKVYARLK